MTWVRAELCDKKHPKYIQHEPIPGGWRYSGKRHEHWIGYFNPEPCCMSHEDGELGFLDKCISDPDPYEYED